MKKGGESRPPSHSVRDRLEADLPPRLDARRLPAILPSPRVRAEARRIPGKPHSGNPFELEDRAGGIGPLPELNPPVVRNPVGTPLARIPLLTTSGSPRKALIYRRRWCESGSFRPVRAEPDASRRACPSCSSERPPLVLSGPSLELLDCTSDAGSVPSAPPFGPRRSKGCAAGPEPVACRDHEDVRSTSSHSYAGWA
jgi:hypothetical protein